METNRLGPSEIGMATQKPSTVFAAPEDLPDMEGCTGVAASVIAICAVPLGRRRRDHWAPQANVVRAPLA
jgi:hypothetical protein